MLYNGLCGDDNPPHGHRFDTYCSRVLTDGCENPQHDPINLGKHRDTVAQRGMAPTNVRCSAQSSTFSTGFNTLLMGS